MPKIKGVSRPIEFLVLSVLVDQPLHGYGLAKAIEERSDHRVRLRPGNLYRVLDRLVDSGLLSDNELCDEPSGGGERTRQFAITAEGRRVVAAEAKLLTQMIRGSKKLSRAVEQELLTPTRK